MDIDRIRNIIDGPRPVKEPSLSEKLGEAMDISCEDNIKESEIKEAQAAIKSVGLGLIFDHLLKHYER